MPAPPPKFPNFIIGEPQLLGAACSWLAREDVLILGPTEQSICAYWNRKRGLFGRSRPNSHSDLARDCILLTTERFVKVESGRLLSLVELSHVHSVSRQKNGAFAWDKVVCVRTDQSVETFGIADNAACEWFEGILRRRVHEIRIRKAKLQQQKRPPQAVSGAGDRNLSDSQNNVGSGLGSKVVVDGHALRSSSPPSGMPTTDAGASQAQLSSVLVGIPGGAVEDLTFLPTVTTFPTRLLYCAYLGELGPLREAMKTAGVYPEPGSRKASREPGLSGHRKRKPLPPTPGEEEQKEAEVNPLHATDAFGFTPLCLAAEQGHLEAVELLLEAGSDVGHRTKFYGWTPLLLSLWGVWKRQQHLGIGVDARTPEEVFANMPSTSRKSSSPSRKSSGTSSSSGAEFQAISEVSSDANSLSQHGFPDLCVWHQDTLAGGVADFNPDDSASGGAWPEAPVEEPPRVFSDWLQRDRALVLLLLNAGADPSAQMMNSTVFGDSTSCGGSAGPPNKSSGQGDSETQPTVTAKAYFQRNGHRNRRRNSRLRQHQSAPYRHAAENNFEVTGRDVEEGHGWNQDGSKQPQDPSEEQTDRITRGNQHRRGFGGGRRGIPRGDWDPLMLAIQARRLDLLRLLLQHGATPDLFTRAGGTALWSTCSQGWFQGSVVPIAKLLLQHSYRGPVGMVGGAAKDGPSRSRSHRRTRLGPRSERNQKIEIQREEQFRHLLWVCRKANLTGVLQLLQGGPAEIFRGSILEQMDLPWLLSKYTNLTLQPEDPIIAYTKNLSPKALQSFQKQTRELFETHRGGPKDHPEVVRDSFLLTKFHFIFIGHSGRVTARWPLGLIRRIRRIPQTSRKKAPSQELGAIFHPRRRSSSAADNRSLQSPEKEDKISVPSNVVCTYLVRRISEVIRHLSQSVQLEALGHNTRRDRRTGALFVDFSVRLRFENQQPAPPRQLRLERLHHQLLRLRLLPLLPQEQQNFLQEHPRLFGIAEDDEPGAIEPGRAEREAEDIVEPPSVAVRGECLDWISRSLNALLREASGDRRHQLIEYLS